MTLIFHQYAICNALAKDLLNTRYRAFFYTCLSVSQWSVGTSRYLLHRWNAFYDSVPLLSSMVFLVPLCALTSVPTCGPSIPIIQDLHGPKKTQKRAKIGMFIIQAIWVGFPRTGICLHFCPLKKKKSNNALNHQLTL